MRLACRGRNAGRRFALLPKTCQQRAWAARLWPLGRPSERPWATQRSPLPTRNKRTFCAVGAFAGHPSAATCAPVQRTPHLGAAPVAYCFSQGLKDGARRGDAAAAVLAACLATSTLHLIVVAHDAREKRHALVAFAESEARRGHVAAQLDVTMSGGRVQSRCWAVRVEPAGGAREAAVGGAEFGSRGGGALKGAREQALHEGAPA